MMTNQDAFNMNEFRGNPIPLPNATAVLVLGIISILGCCCYGIVGLICGIVALVLAKGSLKMYYENPSMYTKSSYSNLNAGKICAIIGLALSACMIIYYIYIIATFGWAFFSDPTILYEHFGIEMPA